MAKSSTKVEDTKEPEIVFQSVPIDTIVSQPITAFHEPPKIGPNRFVRTYETEAKIEQDLRRQFLRIANLDNELNGTRTARVSVAIANLIDFKVNPDASQPWQAAIAVSKSEQGKGNGKFVDFSQLKKDASNMMGYTEEYKKVYGKHSALDVLLTVCTKGAYLVQAQWKGIAICYVGKDRYRIVDSAAGSTPGAYLAICMSSRVLHPKMLALNRRDKLTNDDQRYKALTQREINAQYEAMTTGKPLSETGEIEQEGNTAGGGTTGASLLKEIETMNSDLFVRAMVVVRKALEKADFRAHIRTSTVAQNELAALWNAMSEVVTETKDGDVRLLDEKTIAAAA